MPNVLTVSSVTERARSPEIPVMTSVLPPNACDGNKHLQSTVDHEVSTEDSPNTVLESKSSINMQGTGTSNPPSKAGVSKRSKSGRAHLPRRKNKRANVAGPPGDEATGMTNSHSTVVTASTPGCISDDSTVDAAVMKGESQSSRVGTEGEIISKEPSTGDAQYTKEPQQPVDNSSSISHHASDHIDCSADEDGNNPSEGKDSGHTTMITRSLSGRIAHVAEKVPESSKRLQSRSSAENTSTEANDSAGDDSSSLRRPQAINDKPQSFSLVLSRSTGGPTTRAMTGKRRTLKQAASSDELEESVSRKHPVASSKRKALEPMKLRPPKGLPEKSKKVQAEKNESAKASKPTSGDAKQLASGSKLDGSKLTAKQPEALKKMESHGTDKQISASKTAGIAHKRKLSTTTGKQFYCNCVVCAAFHHYSSGL